MGYKLTGAYIYTPRLPSEYQEVEYIQSSGTQLIDTGYLITPNTEVAVDYQFTYAEDQSFCFGIGSDSDTTSGVTFCMYCGNNLYFKAGISDGSEGETWNNIVGTKNTDRHTFVLNNTTFSMYNSSGTLENTTNTKFSITRTAEHSFGIFCWWRTDLGTPAWSNITAAKLYGCKVKESGTLVRDFVPCYRIVDNVIGLYDLANDVFYTNAGTGTFTKGNDVGLQEKQIRPTEYILYEGANGKIVHKITSLEIWLVPTSGTTIKIQDKDVGSSTAGTTSASWGEWYDFASIPTAPSGYHVPTRTEWQDLMNLWQQITGSNSDELIMQHLLIPGAGFKTPGDVQSDIGGGLYWSSTSNNSSTAWGTIFYPSTTYMNTFAHGKTNKLCVRCFKD